MTKPSPIGTHRLPERIVTRLTEAIRAASLVNSSFDGVSSDKAITVTHAWDKGEHPETWPSTTDFIRDRVRLHHGSWIIHPIEAVLEWSLSVDDGTQADYDLVRRLRSTFPNPAVLEEAAAEIDMLRERNRELEAFRSKTVKALEGLK